jgi:CRISPR-associated endoribonuclease Cas6
MCAITCTLGVLSKEAPPRWPGAHLHGVLFRRLREADPAAAEFAHAREPRPFTIAGPVQKGAHLLIRCAGLSEPLASAMSYVFEAGTELDVGPSRVRVLDVELERTSYEDLYDAYVPREAAHERISLRFVSPTTFRVGKANMPMPLPRLLWQSWANRWNAFSEIQLGSFGEWAEEHIVPARFRLRSRVAKVGGATLVGDVGECEYRVLRPESLEARVAAMLAAYSQYCGSGQKTTMGLGATEPLTSWPGRST